jgi:hypothetical protein
MRRLVGVSLRLLLFRQFQILRFFDLEVPEGLGLFGRGQRFCEHTLLVSLSLGNRRCALCFRTLDRSVAFRFGGGNIGVAFDARDIRSPFGSAQSSPCRE